MLDNYNRYKILKIFLKYPTESFGLRQLSRLSKISPPSILNYLKEFEKKELIKKIEKNNNPLYIANRDNQEFKIYKRISIIFELDKSGIVEYIWDKLAPEAIILYGSFSKGESVEDSDVDIFTVGEFKNINIKSYEKKLGYNIHLMGDELQNLSKEFKNNLANGIILKGYLKLLK